MAIAGILAMDPKVLVLDEPTAGLDPAGTKSMMELFRKLNREYGKTVLIVTHDMEQVFGYCDEVVVIENGRVRTHETVREFFRDSSACKAMGVLPPDVITLKEMLIAKGFQVPEDVMDTDTLAKVIAKQVKHHG